ncbi:molybdopterin molybdotransferase MoeA [Corynebacterium sp. J010B-136]|uniref:molybdopterin molybdotransferase MoeA n=1 Tax=Corynebacterium sp. J010B-136 TaxID=2099401 RepID=UPI000CF8830C|nr:molybdopterin molybdotransferase MoeA [Corynebacterium sp. J010B-136]PQM74145.1 molybdopterin molybdenumtransferase MoeA [Corynebacterium sp. J010B-136]
MTSPESHLQRIRQLVADHYERRTEQIPTEKSLGRITSADIIAAFDSPRFDNSQMDGYAVPTADGGAFEVAATIPAGTSPELLAGKAAPIMTGAAVPADAAAIIPVEKATPAEFLEPGETISLPATEPGQFIRVHGCDVAAGSTIISAGTTISAAAIATMASQSIVEVEVFSPARILICTGGAEIQASELADTQDTATIPDANAPMLRALAHAAGIEVVGHVSTNDDPSALKAALAAAIEKFQPDVVVTSGGISAGKFEVVRQVLESSSAAKDSPATAWFGHVDQQPGGPQGCAVFNSVPVICLPGNPVSTLVSFRLFVAPVLGHVPADSWAQLAEATTGIAGRDQFRRGRVEYRSDGATVAHIIGGPGSHLITQAVEATHLIRIPAGAQLDAGSVVQVYSL